MTRKSFSILSCLALLTLLVAIAPATARSFSPAPISEDSWNVEFVGSYDTPGNARGVAVVGSYAYVADEEAGLRIIDVSDPYSSFEVGSYDTPGWADDVAVVGGYAYIADRVGLRIIDVSNPYAPFEAGFCDTPDVTYEVTVAGSYAYVADYGAGLRIIDVSESESPIETSFYDTPGYAYGVAVAEGFAYVADESQGLRIIDVSDPKAPFEIGSYKGWGDSIGVAVAGNHAYISLFGARYAGGLRIIDVSDPHAPFETGFYETPGHPRHADYADGYAYVADNGSWGASLQVIDVSDPDVPAVIGYCYFEAGGYAYDVTVAGTYAYVADGIRGLLILRFTGPAYYVSGRVVDDLDSPLPGVRVSTGAHIATTDVTGAYSLLDLPGGTYTLIPSKLGYTFTPLSLDITVPPNQIGQDFTGQPTGARISTIHLPLVWRSW